MYTNPESNDIVLDSFAGSGTTARAVLALNAEDKGNRKFILIQIPVDTKDNGKQGLNICQKITAERVRRVIKGYHYEGVKEEVLLSRNLTLSALKKAHELLEDIDLAKKEHETHFDEMVTQAGGGKIRLVGKRNIAGKTEGLDCRFTYLKLGPALLGEYRTLGEELPSYEELAKYIFYTETSRDFDRAAMNEKTGKIGAHAGTSYYLLYTPEGNHDRALDLPWLRALDTAEKNRQFVVYCEKLWVHRDDLAKYESDTGRKVRPMLVPFNLK